MNRNELNRKLKQLHSDYVRDMKRIDERSFQKEINKRNELNRELESNLSRIKPPESSLNPQINVDNEVISNNMNQDNEQNQLSKEEKEELKELFTKWKILEKTFPQYRNIWILQFPKWFISLIKNR